MCKRSAAAEAEAKVEADRIAAEADEELLIRGAAEEDGAPGPPKLRPIQIPKEAGGEADDMDDMARYVAVAVAVRPMFFKKARS